MIKSLALKKEVILSMTKLDDFINSYKENIEKLNIPSLNINHIFILMRAII